MTETIGFIGLGIMGKPMALNLIRSGYQLHVFDINTGAVQLLRKEGAIAASSPKQLAGKCDIIITILPDSPQVREVTLGEHGLIHGLSEGKLFIDMSTIDSATEIEIHQRFQQAGADTLDAPVSGGQTGAEQATLSIMVGGSRASFDRALPVFEALGKKISHMGDNGAGQITKSCSQIATALATQGVIEAFTLAENAGVDLAKVREALLGGFAESKALSIAGNKMISRDFSPGFKLQLYNKDLRIAQRAAKAYSLFLPGTQLLFEEMSSLVEQGKGDLDFSALIQVFQKEKSINIRP